ncbi:MAG: bifunctional glutamate N-acetyltransferase/amino-acid acetyltransferase ArgJ [Clostridia bacterium]
MYKIVKGGLTSAIGFQAAGIHAGLKKAKKDMALVVSAVPAVTAAVFTTSQVKAAPVLLDMEHLQNAVTRAVISNSGNANACTGALGYSNALQMAERTAQHLECKKEEIFVFSTGVIGVQLPMKKVEAGIAKIVGELSPTGGHVAAQAILTTDTFTKECCVEVDLGGKKVTIGGAAKGSGMIHPNMATMFAMITTDAAVEKKLLQAMVQEITNKTFNMITVDGDTSTNDTFMVMANGLSGMPLLASEQDATYQEFYQALEYVSLTLSQLIAKDGEGATKFLTVEIIGAATESDARTIAKSICCSSLVKTALFGEDANWGRILAAAGYAGVVFDPYKVSITISSLAGSILVAQNGTGLIFDEARALTILKEKEITYLVEMGAGSAKATAWTCDFSYDYVKINASYRS